MDGTAQTHLAVDKTQVDENEEFVNNIDIRSPLVDGEFSPLASTDEELEELKSLTEKINEEVEKTISIYVTEEAMIPTTLMFSMRNHVFSKKVVYLSKQLPGWKLLYSYLLSSHIYKIILTED